MVKEKCQLDHCACPMKERRWFILRLWTLRSQYDASWGLTVATPVTIVYALSSVWHQLLTATFASKTWLQVSISCCTVRSIKFFQFKPIKPFQGSPGSLKHIYSYAGQTPMVSWDFGSGTTRMRLH